MSDANHVPNQIKKGWHYKFVYGASLFLLICSGCAKQISTKDADYLRLAQQGEFKKALEEIEKTHFRKQDHLLYLLDKATLLHYAGEHQASLALFEKAYQTAEYWESRSLTQSLGAGLSSETTLPYAGEKYERLQVFVYKMISYAVEQKWEEALIEVRRFHNHLERFYGNRPPKTVLNAFGLMVSSLLWQQTGHLDDARIDLNKAAKNNPSSKNLPETGNVILLLSSGTGPRLTGVEHWIGDIRLELPALHVTEAEESTWVIEKEGKQQAETLLLTRMADLAAVTLEDKIDIAKQHRFVKTALKEWIEAHEMHRWRKSDGNHFPTEIFTTLGVAILANSLEQADTRIWRTLPATFQIARFSLPPGRHLLQLSTKGTKSPTRKIEQEIRVQPVGSTWISLRIP